MLKVVNLTKKFGGLVALDSINLEVGEGETRGIIGPNGSGKTTLVNVITGYLPPTSGEVFLRGKKITGLSPYDIVRRGIGRTFQIPKVFPALTVFENICVAAQVKTGHTKSLTPLPKLKETIKIVEEILKILGLSSKADEQAMNLSAGEIKILEFGMTLSQDPSILILDEPTSGVSPYEREKVLEVIKKISKQKTIVIIEHSMDVIMSIAEKVTVLNKGRVIAEGKPKEIIEMDEIQKIYLT